MCLLVNHTKHFVSKLMSFNSDPLLISERAIGQLQNNSNNGAMLIAINHVIYYVNNQARNQKYFRSGDVS